MPRGRPKKIVNMVKPDIFKDTLKRDDQGNKKTIKIITNCSLCGKELYCTPCIIRLQEVTGKAFWHRRCKLDRLNLCETCSEELNSIVDNFIISKNPSLRKY